ncbi:TRAP transporter large permease [Dethiosulfatarculus sandiegensis]|uniref:C4-dicarboxylate ABC transporter permease n=1 Tax=Dethiosulfatarculus sandiegensis TaxID=1429043 RepID=A0A0D2HQW3_9BACT|nr:TRAP transporter large permease subunit [Dethiosulfatarculus sandiegensis]KIX12868.1 C4-dicarboxylate ABC transporter permease [Dethiosulfatarculus sandiegensis]
MNMVTNNLWRRYCVLTDFLVSKAFFLAVGCLVLMVIPITLDVILRSVSNLAISGTIEIEELLMLMLVFLSLAGPQLRHDHIDMDFFFPHFPKFLQRLLFVFHWALSLILIALLMFEVLAVALERMEQPHFTEVFLITIYPFYFIAAGGLLLLIMALIKCLGKAIAECIDNRSYLAVCLGLCLPVLVYLLPWLLEDTALSWNYLLTGSTGFLALIVLLILRMPIGYAMMLIGVVGLMLINPDHLSPLQMMGLGAPQTAMSYTMSVVPLFILMGELALYSGISSDLFEAASKWLQRLPGGLAIASVAGCAGFAAICGDSFATAMTMSSVALPEMKSRNYNNGMACAALASGGTLGILIPPSVGFIFYAIITEESLGKLFMAGVIPGILLATLFCVVLYMLARIRPELAPIGQKYPLSEKLRSLKGVLPMLGLVVFVLGGMLAGAFSPTEAGAVGAAGTFALAVVTRRLSWKGFIAALKSSVNMTSKLMLIMIGVNLFGYFMAATQIPTELANVIKGITTSKYLVFAMVVLLYILLGCMLNVIPMILLTLPAIYPTIQALGFDPIWFGVVTVLLMEMGQITPPMGLVVFAISGMPDGAPMAEIFKYVVLFVGCMLLVVALLTAFPQIALFLPNTLI